MTSFLSSPGVLSPGAAWNQHAPCDVLRLLAFPPGDAGEGMQSRRDLGPASFKGVLRPHRESFARTKGIVGLSF